MKHQPLLSLLIAGAMLGTAGCELPTNLLTPAGVQKAGKADGVVITGAVMAPAGIIAVGGGNVIAPGGGNYHTLALTESALANAEVFLADAAGEPVPGIAPVKTDKNGQYKFENVPKGYTFVVAAKAKTKEGKSAVLQTIAKAEDLGATANVSASSTLVAAAVLEGQGGKLGEFNPAKFKTATEATKKNLKDGELPDFSDRAAIVAKMNALVEAVAELKSVLAEIKEDLAKINEDLDSIKEALEQRQGTQPLQPQPTQPKDDLMPPPDGQQPPPDGQQPPPDGQQPPPDGQQPAQGATFLEFTFVLEGPFEADEFPVTVGFKAPDGKIVAYAEFREAAGKAVAKLPAGLGHTLWLKTAKAPTPVEKGWFVNPKDNAHAVKLPLPRGTGAQAPTGGQTPTNNTGGQTPTDTNQTQQPPAGVEHEFTVKEDKFKETDFPVVVEFRVPDKPDVVARIEFKSATDRPVAKVPHRLGHHLWVKTTRHDFMIYWHGWTIYEDTRTLMLPFGTM